MTTSGEGADDARSGSVGPRLAPGRVAGLLAVTVAFGGAAMAWGQGEGVRLHAAGSLRAALTEVARAFTAAHGVPVTLVFGASGLLRERLERGEPGDVFASANMEHPQALAQAGKAGPVVMFARNRLCALARPDVGATSDTLLDRMLDPAVTLGISTPRADPSGDYAWEVFRRAETLRPGSQARLEAKARQFVGGPTSPRPRRTGASTPSSWQTDRPMCSSRTARTRPRRCARRRPSRWCRCLPRWQSARTTA